MADRSCRGRDAPDPGEDGRSGHPRETAPSCRGRPGTRDRRDRGTFRRERPDPDPDPHPRPRPRRTDPSGRGPQPATGHFGLVTLRHAHHQPRKGTLTLSAPLRVAGPTGDPLAEAIALTKRLKLPYLRRALTDLVPTAKAQRWDPAEVVRVLLAEEAAGRDATNLRTRRKRAGFPAGKTFGDWDEGASSIPRPTQDALKT